MRLSAFNLYVEGYPEPGATLVHNTLSGAFVVLDDETMAALRRADAGEDLAAAERALVDDPDLSEREVGVVVASREAEELEFRQWFEAKRSRAASLDVLVCVNLACNFDCPYCSQAGILDGTVMKPEVADRTADWIAARAIEVGVGKVVIGFCGGEPLLHPERIRRIATRVRQRGVALEFTLITNGYFLDQEMLDTLIPLGLTGAKITLDGNGTTHKLTRVSKKGEDTYARIFAHVIAASRRIRVNVNGNYTRETVHGFLPLLAELADGGLPAGTRVSLTPALEGLQSLDWNGGGMCTWSDADTAQHIAMQDEALRRGFDTPPMGVVGPCEFHDHHSFAIDPAGEIFKCPGFLGHAGWGIGHVDTGLEGEKYRRMVRATPQASCDGCAHRPGCGGGCVASVWVKSGEAAGVNCEKPFFERVKEEVVVRRYLLATSDTVSEAVAAFPSPRISEPPSRSRRVASLRVVAA
jgi:uncharacterized protein